MADITGAQQIRVGVRSGERHQGGGDQLLLVSLAFDWSTCFSRCNVIPNKIHGIRVPGPLNRTITSPRPQKHRNQVLVTGNTADPGAKLVVAGDGQYLGRAREYGETA